MLLEANNVSFHYPSGNDILKNITVRIGKDERVGIVAPSGYGKSTLSKLLAGYIKPTEGEVLLNHQSLPERGYCPVQLIYQNPEHALNPRLQLKSSLCEGWTPDEELLMRAGIETEWLERYPAELSGGELQRICIVRAFGPKTDYVIADEMTAMLDMITQAQIWQMTLELAERNSIGMLVITHDMKLAEKVCTRVVDLEAINHLS